MSMMTLPEPIVLVNPAVPTEPIWRLSVEQYHAMIQAGTLTKDNHVELLEGWLVPKMPKKPPHSVATPLIQETLTPLLPAEWHLRVQEPITTLESEPEPDLALVEGNRRRYANRHPLSEEVAQTIEVSDTTLQRDRTTKKRIYARASIPVYWIVNLVDRIVEVYTDPTGPVENPDYRKRQDYGSDQEVPFVLDGKELARIKVLDLLP